MARRLINVSFNVKKLDKRKFRTKGDDVYCDITLVETPDGKYGQWMVVQDQTKEERDNRVKGTILGNGKNRNWGSEGNSGNSNQSSGGYSERAGNTDDLPI